MAIEIFVGQNALGTDGTGTNDLTSADSSTIPVGVLHIPTRGTVNGTSRNDCMLSVGMGDGTNEYSASMGANDFVATSDCNRGVYDKVIAYNTAGTNTEAGGDTHNSFIAGGERVNEVNAHGFAHLCNSMFFAGCNVAVEQVVIDDVEDTAVNVDPGFAWDVVIVANSDCLAIDAEASDTNMSFGFYVKDTDSQGCIIIAENNTNAAPGNQHIIISNTYAGGKGDEISGGDLDGTNSWGIDVAQGSGTSCDLYPRLDGGELELVNLLFLGFTDNTIARLVEWDSPTSVDSPGDNSITGIGLQPIALIHILSYCEAYGTVKSDFDGGVFGISLITDDSQYCFSSTNEENTGGNTNCKSLANNQSIHLRRDNNGESATTALKASHVSMDSDGWTENWENMKTSGARKQLTLAIGTPPGGSGAHFRQGLFL